MWEKCLFPLHTNSFGIQSNTVAPILRMIMAGEKGKHTVAQAGGKSVIKGTKWADPVKKMAN